MVYENEDVCITCKEELIKTNGSIYCLNCLSKDENIIGGVFK